MLVLKRLQGEAIHIGGNVVITVIGVDGGRVMLGIEAPREIQVLRGELLNRPTPPTPPTHKERQP